MQRLLTSILSLALVAGVSTGASAKVCRDAHGHFMKCKTMMAMHKQCRDKHGKFMKCPTMMGHHM